MSGRRRLGNTSTSVEQRGATHLLIPPRNDHPEHGKCGRTKICVAAAAAVALGGCLQQGTAGGPVTGAAGRLQCRGGRQLQRCAEPLDTLAVDDWRTSSWFGPFTARTQITTIEPMVRPVYVAAW